MLIVSLTMNEWVIYWQNERFIDRVSLTMLIVSLTMNEWAIYWQNERFIDQVSLTMLIVSLTMNEWVIYWQNERFIDRVSLTMLIVSLTMNEWVIYWQSKRFIDRIGVFFFREIVSSNKKAVETHQVSTAFLSSSNPYLGSNVLFIFSCKSCKWSLLSLSVVKGIAAINWLRNCTNCPLAIAGKSLREVLLPNENNGSPKLMVGIAGAGGLMIAANLST